VAPHVADILVDHWLATEFAGGDSARKVGKIDALDAGRTAAAKGANS
jgi:ribose 5-phosphate isomerase RpiB